MELRLTKSFDKAFAKLGKGNQKLLNKVNKTLNNLIDNPNHPSLRLHKLESSEYWSISVDMSIRILIIFEDDLIYVYDIGKHDDVY